MLVCVSGSFSGIRCGGQVATGVIYNDYCTWGGTLCYTAINYVVNQVSQQALAGEGDSGAPTWENNNDCSANGNMLGCVSGVGLLGGGFFGTPQNPIEFVRACTGQTTIGNPAYPRICSWKVYISNIIFALNAAYGTGNGRIYSITPN